MDISNYAYIYIYVYRAKQLYSDDTMADTTDQLDLGDRELIGLDRMLAKRENQPQMNIIYRI